LGRLLRDFSLVDGIRRSEWQRLRRHHVQRQKEQKQKEERELAEEDFEVLTNAITVATNLEVTQFHAKLDKYDTAIVTALMENQEQLDLINLKILQMLEKAYVLEDGRKVFKTQDGTQVFDEHGAELLNEDFDPTLIPDSKPTWEEYSSAVQVRDSLNQERAEILEYQQKVDEARIKSSEEGFTTQELEELDQMLEDEMPKSLLPPDCTEISVALKKIGSKFPVERSLSAPTSFNKMTL